MPHSGSVRLLVTLVAGSSAASPEGHPRFSFCTPPPPVRTVRLRADLRLLLCGGARDRAAARTQAVGRTRALRVAASLSEARVPFPESREASLFSRPVLRKGCA